MRTALQSHAHFEFLLIMKGEGLLLLDGREYALRPGSLCFIRPFDLYEVLVESGHSLRLYQCCFDWTFSGRAGALPAPQKRAIDDLFAIPRVLQLKNGRRTEAVHLMQSMVEEGAQVDRYTDLMTRSYTLSLYDLYRQEAYASNKGKGEVVACAE